ncbi:hypothetical protein [Hydrogenophaga sp.]|uniref:hypothetical protein n=1 Tax=Hydrogenophaga sp. TaxID=1904254 RepID=UPI0026113348|nr:hypothetical protein [Hydrogenophaga sp.]MCW5655556.1 hypothetical protein [Hydrogenophaga sp.]
MRRIQVLLHSPYSPQVGVALAHQLLEMQRCGWGREIADRGDAGSAAIVSLAAAQASVELGAGDWLGGDRLLTLQREVTRERVVRPAVDRAAPGWAGALLAGASCDATRSPYPPVQDPELARKTAPFAKDGFLDRVAVSGDPLAIAMAATHVAATAAEARGSWARTGHMRALLTDAALDTMQRSGTPAEKALLARVVLGEPPEAFPRAREMALAWVGPEGFAALANDPSASAMAVGAAMTCLDRMPPADQEASLRALDAGRATGPLMRLAEIPGGGGHRLLAAGPGSAAAAAHARTAGDRPPAPALGAHGSHRRSEVAELWRVAYSTEMDSGPGLALRQLAHGHDVTDPFLVGRARRVLRAGSDEAVVQLMELAAHRCAAARTVEGVRTWVLPAEFMMAYTPERVEHLHGTRDPIQAARFGAATATLLAHMSPARRMQWQAASRRNQWLLTPPGRLDQLMRDAPGAGAAAGAGRAPVQRGVVILPAAETVQLGVALAPAADVPLPGDGGAGGAGADVGAGAGPAPLDAPRALPATDTRPIPPPPLTATAVRRGRAADAGGGGGGGGGGGVPEWMRVMAQAGAGAGAEGAGAGAQPPRPRDPSPGPAG